MTFNAMQARDLADEENDFVADMVAGYLRHHKLQEDRSNAVGICRDVLCHFNSKYLPVKEQSRLIVKAAGVTNTHQNLERIAYGIECVIRDARNQFRAYSAGVRYV